MTWVLLLWLTYACATGAPDYAIPFPSREACEATEATVQADFGFLRVGHLELATVCRPADDDRRPLVTEAFCRWGP